MINIDLGSGVNKPEGFVGIDKFTRTDIRGDITYGLPFKTESVGVLRARDVLEHIPPEFVIPVMNDCWRVLTPDGFMHIDVPRAPHIDAFKDPTHVSFWVVETFTEYFCGPSRLEAEYGFKMWDIVTLEHAEHRIWTALKRRL